MKVPVGFAQVAEEFEQAIDEAVFSGQGRDGLLMGGGGQQLGASLDCSPSTFPPLVLGASWTRALLRMRLTLPVLATVMT